MFWVDFFKASRQMGFTVLMQVSKKVTVYCNANYLMARSHCSVWLPVFALERDFASLYTLWGELSQNELTNASALSLPGETLKTDGRNLSIIGSDDVHISS